ncbi:DNA-binding GntR family transcriptional regulator [Microbacterium halimionae]|uniref:DNA-binding GntR family transcriptional regulator n=1 Tax=Microbacterium halimionae TaxID=1526413 RepID=A0A7W3JQF1_9MICO|nr:GntR family transcriptional regulator [Microbacterium halimionae]MBA8817105.1 DNA-binding GntR family transcriptional regulator [Microbacterium halimionae]NII94355.1 DNA-binding GntR family transcriptional regulator [Microbacterium halimionae]
MTDSASFSPLDPRGVVLGDEVFAVLGQAILDGRLMPGQRLRDVDLADQLRVSRTPVREALQRLERFGLVEIAANRWTRVTTPSPTALHDTQEFIVHLVRDALTLGLPRCSTEQLELIIAASDALIAASEADSSDAMLGTTVMMYQQMIRATGNEVFIQVMREAGIAFQRNLRGWQHPDPDVEVRTNNYRALRDAIARRDAPAAERALFANTLDAGSTDRRTTESDSL